ncbi:hypothetical protein [Phycicoccus avicenniae]|uniref:hypothetical protein n=1 Tax=Phycicoccus avicenniae TaxID=2828860 RepID=UPI003D2B5E26
MVALAHVTGQTIGRPGLTDPLAFYAYPLTPPRTVADWTAAQVQIHTTWAPPPTGLEASDLLVAGLLAYGDEDFNAAVLHLHTALDVLAAHRAETILPSLGLPKRARSLLTLPERLAFIQLHTDSVLSEQAQASVSALNRLRNDRVAHNGRRLTVMDVVEPICGAVAVVWWLYLLPPITQ